jgi:hypothetical protein
LPQGVSHGLPADLTSVVGAWDDLPQPLKAAVLAIVKSDRSSR